MALCASIEPVTAQLTTEREIIPISYPPKPNFTDPVNYFAWYRDQAFEPDWPHGEEVYASLIKASKDERFPKPDKTLNRLLSRAYSGPWSSDEMPELVEYIRYVEPFIKDFDQAARVENVQWLFDVEPGGWMTLKIPSSLVPFRVLTKINLARAWRDFQPDHEHANMLLRAWKANFVHARHLERQSFTSGLVVMANRAINYTTIRRALESGALQSEDLRHVLDLMNRQDRQSNPSLGMLFEWAGLLDFLQAVYPDGKCSDDAVERLGQGKFLPKCIGFLQPSPHTTALKMTSWFKPYVRAARQPWSASALRTMKAHGERRAEIAGSDLILSTYLRGFSGFYSIALRRESARRATLLLLEIHRCHEQSARWPASLDECNLEDLDTLRSDPVAGRDFVYEVRDGKPRLYSVGFDGTDDGGNHDGRWASKEPGGDFVFFPLPDTNR